MGQFTYQRKISQGIATKSFKKWRTVFVITFCELESLKSFCHKLILDIDIYTTDKFLYNCAKLRASRVFVPYVPLLLTCLPFYVSWFFLRALRFFNFFTCLTSLYFFTCLTCVTCPHLLTCPHLFKCFTCLHFLTCLLFLSVSNFWRALCAFTFLIKCGTIH